MPLRVLMVQRFDLQTVGCATRIAHQAEELVRRGHTITLVQYPHSGRRAAMVSLRSLPQGVAVIDLDRRASRLRQTCRRVAELAQGCDLIHLWKCYPDAALPAIGAAVRHSLPLHYDWDDWEEGTTQDLVNSRSLACLVGRWERFVPRIATTVSVASRALRGMAEALGLSLQQVFDVPVGADAEAYDGLEPAPGNWPFPTLIYIGQLETASYAEQCVDALHAVHTRYPQARLLVIGGGTRAALVAQRAAAVGLSEAVTLPGYLDEETMRRHLLAADVALAPFEDNPVTRCKSPLKLCEYMAAGLPVVASDVGEARHLLGAAGVYVPAGDGDAMGRAVLRLLDDPALRESMSRAGLLRAQIDCHWRRTVDVLERAWLCATTGADYGPSTTAA